MVNYKHGLRLGIILFALVLTGCASTNHAPHPDDPFESFNRVSYQFNSKLDKFVLKPVATVYDTVTPKPVKKGVLNVFANMGEVPTFANDVLQGHPTYAAKDFCRFAINSTIGIGGFFDVASKMNLPRRYNDFGLTLARWGIRRSSYLVIPFIGPSTLRDGVGLLVNLRYLTLWPYIKPIAVRNSLFALDVVSLRGALLDAEGIMDEAALDPYVFIRNAYLQKRASLINQNEEFPGGAEGLGADPLNNDNVDFALGENDDIAADTAVLESVTIENTTHTLKLQDSTHQPATDPLDQMNADFSTQVIDSPAS